LVEKQTSGSLILRKQPTQKYKMINFDTIKICNITSGVIATITHPMVNYDTNMYGNWKFTFSLV